MKPSKSRKKKSLKEYKLMFEDTVALVLATNDDWVTCCITELAKDGTWHCGMNLITSPDRALRCAEKRKIDIIFKSQLKKQEDKSNV